MEEDILYVFSQENKPTSYKQGMNEILAIFIHSFYPFYITSPVTNYTSDKFDFGVVILLNILMKYILFSMMKKSFKVIYIMLCII